MIFLSWMHKKNRGYPWCTAMFHGTRWWFTMDIRGAVFSRLAPHYLDIIILIYGCFKMHHCLSGNSQTGTAMAILGSKLVLIRLNGSEWLRIVYCQTNLQEDQVGASLSISKLRVQILVRYWLLDKDSYHGLWHFPRFVGSVGCLNYQPTRVLNTASQTLGPNTLSLAV